MISRKWSEIYEMERFVMTFEFNKGIFSNSFKFVGESTWGRKNALFLLIKDKGYEWKIKKILKDKYYKGYEWKIKKILKDKYYKGDINKLFIEMYYIEMYYIEMYNIEMYNIGVFE